MDDWGAPPSFPLPPLATLTPAARQRLLASLVHLPRERAAGRAAVRARRAAVRARRAAALAVPARARTSSTTMWLSPPPAAAPARWRSSTPVVQKSSRVCAERRTSPRTA